jgi:hypothetical protein
MMVSKSLLRLKLTLACPTVNQSFKSTILIRSLRKDIQIVTKSSKNLLNREESYTLKYLQKKMNTRRSFSLYRPRLTNFRKSFSMRLARFSTSLWKALRLCFSMRLPASRWPQTRWHWRPLNQNILVIRSRKCFWSLLLIKTNTWWLFSLSTELT